MSFARKPGSALGYYNYAASYNVAADFLSEHGLRATHPAVPASFLYYHTIELYLKSVLRLHGVSAEELEKEYRHNYRKLRLQAEKHGLALGDTEREVFDLVADGEVWIQARYLKTGPLREPTLEGLRQTSSALRIW